MRVCRLTSCRERCIGRRSRDLPHLSQPCSLVTTSSRTHRPDTRSILNGVLQAQRRRAGDRWNIRRRFGARSQTLKIERSYVLLAAESMDDSLPVPESQSMDRDDNNIEDLFPRRRSGSCPKEWPVIYWNEVISAQALMTTTRLKPRP